MPANCCTVQAVTKEQLREWDLSRCLAALETLMAAVLAAGRQAAFPFELLHQLIHLVKLPALCAEDEAAGSPLWQANKIVQEVKALALRIGSMPSVHPHQVRSQLTPEMHAPPGNGNVQGTAVQVLGIHM